MMALKNTSQDGREPPAPPYASDAKPPLGVHDALTPPAVFKHDKALGTGQQPSSERGTGANFVCSFSLQPGDKVAMIGAGTPEIPAAVLRVGGKLIIREYNLPLIAELRKLAAREAPSPEHYDVQTGDFCQLQIEGGVKLVWYPHVLDDPRLSDAARGALIRKGCQLTCGVGFIAASLDDIQVRRETVERAAAVLGFKLEYLGSIDYDGPFETAHRWRCLRAESQASPCSSASH